ncbi:MAG: glycosyltransferase [Clostridia bacterium]|nr:glycosyltransferase [Clostridia bacterium]
MRVVEINATHRGSTGKVMLGTAEVLRQNGNEVYTFSAEKDGPVPKGHQFFSTRQENLIHRIISVFTGISGKGTKGGTRRLLKRLDEIKPDVIHLHNLHGWYINVPMLFDYIKKNNIRTVWTLHDCWGFTAQCSHFTVEKCEKWKTGCYSCPRYRLYPYTFVDRTKKMWKLKKEWLTGVKDLTIVTPSQWLADLVKQSFLKEYPVKVINNGIDLSVFKPLGSDFREKYNLQNKKIVLGVASGWGYRKGLDVFVELSKCLPQDYQIVLVGTDEKVDKQLPDSIISIHRTQNQRELAEIYSMADVFVNPTREENYPTVNMEALACGTPVVTFKTGGSPEIIDSTCGSAVDVDDIDALQQEIRRACVDCLYLREACIERAKGFDMYKRYEEYVNLYKFTERERDK